MEKKSTFRGAERRRAVVRGGTEAANVDLESSESLGLPEIPNLTGEEEDRGVCRFEATSLKTCCFGQARAICRGQGQGKLEGTEASEPEGRFSSAAWFRGQEAEGGKDCRCEATCRKSCRFGQAGAICGGKKKKKKNLKEQKPPNLNEGSLQLPGSGNKKQKAAKVVKPLVIKSVVSAKPVPSVEVKNEKNLKEQAGPAKPPSLHSVPDPMLFERQDQGYLSHDQLRFRKSRPGIVSQSKTSTRREALHGGVSTYRSKPSFVEAIESIQRSREKNKAEDRATLARSHVTQKAKPLNLDDGSRQPAGSGDQKQKAVAIANVKPPAVEKGKRKKRPMSYFKMCGLTLLNAGNEGLKIREIYNFIMTHFPKYTKKNILSWQNSIRSNLTKSDVFIKTKLDNEDTNFTFNRAYSDWFQKGLNKLERKRESYGYGLDWYGLVADEETWERMKAGTLGLPVPAPEMMEKPLNLDGGSLQSAGSGDKTQKAVAIADVKPPAVEPVPRPSSGNL